MDCEGWTTKTTLRRSGGSLEITIFFGHASGIFHTFSHVLLVEEVLSRTLFFL